jgi:hypothetical protein
MSVTKNDGVFPRSGLATTADDSIFTPLELAELEREHAEFMKELEGVDMRKLAARENLRLARERRADWNALRKFTLEVGGLAALELVNRCIRRRREHPAPSVMKPPRTRMASPDELDTKLMGWAERTGRTHKLPEWKPATKFLLAVAMFEAGATLHAVESVLEITHKNGVHYLHKYRKWKREQQRTWRQRQH